jgi:chromosome transmission fidelity protein 4
VDPVPSELPSPVTTEAQAAKRLDKLLDDEFDAEEDEDIEEKGEDLEGQYGDDWIVDDDGQYAADDDEQKWSKGRTEVGELTTISSDPHEWRH